MLADLMDRRNSFAKKLMRQDKVDPGTFSFMEPGWWALHAVSIAGVYMLGHNLAKSIGHGQDYEE